MSDGNAPDPVVVRPPAVGDVLGRALRNAFDRDASLPAEMEMCLRRLDRMPR
jgi:hypothetical protein